MGEELISMLEEAFEVASDYNKFTEWLQCYGKATNCFRVGGRTLWSWKPIPGAERVYQRDHEK